LNSLKYAILAPIPIQKLKHGSTHKTASNWPGGLHIKEPLIPLELSWAWLGMASKPYNYKPIHLLRGCDRNLGTHLHYIALDGA
jgi:hypothetical protein